jgi:hypothetical protein
MRTERPSWGGFVIVDRVGSFLSDGYFIAEDADATSASTVLADWHWPSPFLFAGMTTTGSIL